MSELSKDPNKISEPHEVIKVLDAAGYRNDAKTGDWLMKRPG